MSSAKSGKVALGNSFMKYAVFGSGKKNFVILPGLSINDVTDVAGAAKALSKMYGIFTKDFTVYLFDRKNDVPEGYSVSDIADDTAEAMKLLGIEKASLLGVSQGGMIAQVIAEKYPDTVEKLVLAATLSRQNETVKEVIGKWISLAEQGDFKELNRNSIDKLYSEKYIEKNKLLLPLAIMTKPRDPERFRVLANACLTFDGYDALGGIKCHVLVIGGRKDLVVTCAASEEMAEKLGCGLYIFEDYGHALYDEAEEFKDMVYDFLMK